MVERRKEVAEGERKVAVVGASQGEVIADTRVPHALLPLLRLLQRVRLRQLTCHVQTYKPTQENARTHARMCRPRDCGTNGG